jgi:hypothetical protein
MQSAVAYADTVIYLPLAGNTWAKGNVGDRQLITNAGIENWTQKETQFDTYLRVNKPGAIKIKLKAKTNGQSRLQLAIGHKTKAILINEKNIQVYDSGTWEMHEAGYVKINLKGTEKTGEFFADINEYEISGTAIDAQTAYVKNNEDNYFYWGRRGPSVHLSYDVSEANGDIEYFYNEVTVPIGNDVIGSYFMANGFAEGYFGIQVNSPTERRILFSVWSPFNTDDPKQIPDDKKIIMLKKGKDVYTGVFGNEGSGGQSYLRYSWKAGETYRFLIKAEPTEKNYTNYTAYFYAAEQNKWLLIASFSRPATSTYLTRLHSFLENFDPATGNTTRKAWYGNQWVRTTNGEWQPIFKAKFTGDATAQKGYRLDYGGGVEKGKFFLRNCGFFDEYTALKSIFAIQPPLTSPDINLFSLE